ncbi:SIR2 family protein [Arthrobacter sp. A2-55]|uniref:SIR2 family protein n=1 Tax=Arthrobacter sp. A2-55 TaxID=2897337 RepID=UPI0021CD2214|nr:SIR2 family protein [Arthrobacter sp. A2-55]MCU6480615.1 SIR2 family protein [Arthrobacter sp. A2-55]
MDDEAFILGAGFSRAISDFMPLTDDLGSEVVARDPNHLGRSDSKRSFASSSFEAWLSRRAEKQPYLSAAENLENQGIFARGRSLIAEVLDERVDSALSQPLPVWLGELLSLWHLRKSNVLTFNYDTLVESAFESMRLWDWRAETFFQWGSLINYSPPGNAGRSIGEANGIVAPHPSFRLWKLHGSLNWHWVPDDPTGATVVRGRLPGLFDAPVRVTSDEFHWSVPGRERFIVPPAALKSGYYTSPVIREVWSRAYSALRSAKVITLMGYSLPATDLSASGMLAEALSERTTAEIRIVDFAPGSLKSPTSIASRVQALGKFGGKVMPLGEGSSAIPDYVRRLVDEAALKAVTELCGLPAPDERLMLVDWGDEQNQQPGMGRSAAIVKSHGIDAEGTLVLETDPLRSIDATHASRSGQIRFSIQSTVLAKPLPFSEIRADIHRAIRIKLKVPDASRLVTVIASTERRFTSGEGDGRWLSLVPAGLCI